MRISDWSSDVCSSDLANAYADGLQRGLDDIAAEAARLPRRPRVYFEEWDEPPITGIRWVAELVRIAGGDDVFPERALEPPAKARTTEAPAELVRREPDHSLGHGGWDADRGAQGKRWTGPGTAPVAPLSKN